MVFIIQFKKVRGAVWRRGRPPSLALEFYHKLDFSV
jgi:hypothetical protein